MSTTSRRRFIALTGAGLGAAALWTRTHLHSEAEVSRGAQAAGAGAPPASDATPPAPQPTPTPPPLRPRGREYVTLLRDTPWAAEGVAIHSGVRGPRVIVLGGVHGNEPGGWVAAEGIAADWQVERGSLLVLPKLNWQAAARMERTVTGFGDLNRAYPGDPNGPPMAKMAAAIVATAREFQPDLLLDLHESWMFYSERGSNNGTAFIGQTVAVGRPEAAQWVATVVESANLQMTGREQLTLRSVRQRGTPTPGPFQAPTPGTGAPIPGGTSSLSLGNWVPGLAPVLIEMGQYEQAESRRSALHQLFVRTALDRAGML